MDSRMMSACPACRAVSSMRCSRTQRGVQTMPAGIHGTTVGRGRSGAPRSARSRDDLLGLPGLLVGQRRARRRASRPSTRRNPSDQSSWGDEDGGVARREEGRPGPLDQSAACLTRPARLSSLTVGRADGLLVGQAVGGVAQGVALLAEEGEEHLALVDDGGLRVQAWCHLRFCRSEPALCVGDVHGAPRNWPSSGHFSWQTGPMRADRLVAALLVLQAKGRVTAAELAEELEVSERTARRDLEGLALAGHPRLLPARAGRRLGAGRRGPDRPERADRRRGPRPLPDRRARPPPRPRCGRPCASSCRPSRRPSASTPKRRPAPSCATRPGGTTGSRRRPTHLEDAPAGGDRGRAGRAWTTAAGTARRLVAHGAPARPRGQEQHLVPRRRHRRRPADLPGEPGALGGADRRAGAYAPTTSTWPRPGAPSSRRVDAQRAPVAGAAPDRPATRRRPALHVRQPDVERSGATGWPDGRSRWSSAGQSERMVARQLAGFADAHRGAWRPRACGRTWPTSAGAWCAAPRPDGAGSRLAPVSAAAAAAPTTAPAASSRSSLWAGPISCRLAGNGPAGRHRQRQRRHAGQVDREGAARRPGGRRPRRAAGGKMVRVGVTRKSTSVKSSLERRLPARAGRPRRRATVAVVEGRSQLQPVAHVGADALGVLGHQDPVGVPGLDHEQEAGLHGGARSHPGRRGRGTSHPARRRARSTAAVMAGSASMAQAADGEVGARRPRRRRSPARAAPCRDQAGHVAGHRADGVEARRQRPHPVERDAAPGRLEAGDAATGGGDTDRAAGVAAVGHVGLARGDGDRRSARRPAGDAGGIERVHRRAVPRVDAGHPEGQLVQVGAPDDPGPGRPGSGQAGGVAGPPVPARSATARQPAVVGSPSMSMRSLTARRTPGPDVS